MGDPVDSYATPSGCSPTPAAAAAASMSRRRSTFLAWGLVEGPWPVPEAIARCDALAREAAGQRAAELNLRGCRAVLMAMPGRYDEARARWPSPARGSPSCTWA